MVANVHVVCSGFAVTLTSPRAVVTIKCHCTTLAVFAAFPLETDTRYYLVVISGIPCISYSTDGVGHPTMLEDI